MYEFSVGAMFRNEGMILREWIEHYRFHGADHIYLINDQSTDDFMSILQPYIEMGFLSLFHFNAEKYLGRQRDAYNRFFLPLIQKKETEWLAVLDLDEFLWSPREIDLRVILRQCKDIPQIQICPLRFGSNGHVTQPKSIVQSFIKREKEETSCNRKVIVNSHFQFSSINIHHSTCIDSAKIILLDWNSDRENPYFLINHYCVQSIEYWQKIKMTRGDADAYLSETARDMDYYWRENKNEIEDGRLAEQNYKNLKINQ